MVRLRQLLLPLPRNWKGLAFWVVTVVATLACVAVAIRQLADDQLTRDAERAALGWADFAVHTVPDLEPAFAGRGISPRAQEQLSKLRLAAEVFRFKLFDADGVLVLVSDDFDKPGVDLSQPLQRQGEAIGVDHDKKNSKVRSVVLSGRSWIETTHAARPDRPPVFSEAYVPMLRDGRVMGIVEVYIDQTEVAKSARRMLTGIAAVVAILLSLPLALAAWQFWRHLRQKQQVEARVRYLAEHDVLSGALNRTSFNAALRDEIWRRSEGGPGFALLCIDLDRFKEVNDAHGHAAGDEVLRHVVQRLQSLVRQGDQVARLGGDEFAILQSGVSGPRDVTILAQRVVDTLRVPYELPGLEVHCGCSLGAAIHGVDAVEQEDLMHKADLALFRAKREMRGTFSFYDAGMDEQLKTRHALTADLRAAIGTDAMSLHYQPLFASDATTLTGYEALLRWHHPERGNVPPNDFIALAEDTGLIDPLGRWVIERACASAAGWPSPLSVAVNLSVAQFRTGDLVAVVAHALETAGLPAWRLELEITESLLMSDAEQVMRTLRELSAMGVRIAMDDFGTGYSSLAYLWRFPFDKVKIDQAFTQSLGDDPKVDLIVRSIISLAHSLNIRVNAEGVESPAQLAHLRALGCDELQGFLLGRPAPLAALSHAGAAVADVDRVRRVRRPATGSSPALQYI